MTSGSRGLRQRGSLSSTSVSARFLPDSALVRAMIAMPPRAIQRHGAAPLVRVLGLVAGACGLAGLLPVSSLLMPLFSLLSGGFALRLSALGRTALPLACPSRVAVFAGLLSPGSAWLGVDGVRL